MTSLIFSQVLPSGINFVLKLCYEILRLQISILVYKIGSVNFLIIL